MQTRAFRIFVLSIGGVFFVTPALAQFQNAFPFNIAPNPRAHALQQRIFEQLVELGLAILDAEGRLRRAQGMMAEAEAMKAQAEGMMAEAEAVKAQAEALHARNQAVREYFELLIELHALRQRLLDLRIKQAAFRKRVSISDTAVPSAVELNWMLRELASDILAADFGGPGSQIRALAEQVTFTEEELAQIRVTDTDIDAHGRLFWDLRDRQPLELDWPIMLRGDEFGLFRERLEGLRSQMLSEIRQSGQIEKQTYDRVVEELRTLEREFDRRYPIRGLPLSHEAMRRLEAKAFIKRVRSEVERLSQPDAAGGLKKIGEFRGNSLWDILQYLVRNGAQFADYERGGEAVYLKLVQSMRSIYNRIHANSR